METTACILNNIPYASLALALEDQKMELTAEQVQVAQQHLTNGEGVQFGDYSPILPICEIVCY